jgi:hypothetical protein
MLMQLAGRIASRVTIVQEPEGRRYAYMIVNGVPIAVFQQCSRF